MKFFLLYLDPGSGNYILQAIIAGVLGVGFYFKAIKYKIRSFFKKDDGVEDEHLPEDENPPA